MCLRFPFLLLGGRLALCERLQRVVRWGCAQRLSAAKAAAVAVGIAGLAKGFTVGSTWILRVSTVTGLNTRQDGPPPGGTPPKPENNEKNNKKHMFFVKN